MKRNMRAFALSILIANHMFCMDVLAAESGRTTVVNGREYPVPDFIAQADDEEKLTDCVVQGLQERGLDDDQALAALLTSGKVDALYRTFLADWPKEALVEMGVDPENQRDDQAKLAAIEVLLRPLSDNDAFDAFKQLRMVARVRAAQAEAIGIDCPTPPHLQPGGDPDREWMIKNQDLLLEYAEFDKCVGDRYEEKYRDLVGTKFWPLHETIPAEEQANIRKLVAEQVAAEGVASPEEVKKIVESEKIDLLLLRYDLSMGMRFDMRLIAKSNTLHSYYKNRYLKLGCTPAPSPALLELAGIRPE